MRTGDFLKHDKLSGFVQYVQNTFVESGINNKVMESRCENCIVRQFNSLRAMNKEELKKVSDSKVYRKIKKRRDHF